MLGRPQKLPPFRIPVRSRPPLPPGALPFFWHPDRDGVVPAPAWFADGLARIHADLAVTRAPPRSPCVTAAWLVWYRKAEVRHPLCPGWLLLFIWRDPETRTRLPLDERIFANLYLRDARQFSSGRAYFDHIVADLAREAKASRHADDTDRRDRMRDLYRYWQIKNVGHGAKFARHHDGSVMPSAGERAWIQERGARDRPAEVTRRLAEEPPLPSFDSIRRDRALGSVCRDREPP